MKIEALLRGSDGVPLYVQVRERLRENLAKLKPGARIPPESILMERFAVSRITLRKAIDELAAEGLLIRKQGRGTFTSVPKLVHELNAITSWTDQLKALGYKPHTAGREAVEMPAPKPIARLLQLDPGDKVFQLKRMRLANQEPVTFMVNYLPSKLTPGLAAYSGKKESLYELLESIYKLVPAEATDTVETRPAAEDEAEKLGIEPWAPVLVVTRVSYLENGRPLEVTVAVSRGDRYEYRVKLRGRARSAPSYPERLEDLKFAPGI